MLLTLFKALTRSGRRAAVEPPAAIANDMPDVAAGLIKRGNEALRAGRLDDAANCYREASRAQPRLAAAPLNLGFVLMQQSRADEAISPLELAAALQPNSLDAHYMLGTAHASRGAVGVAIAHFERAIAVDPHFVLARRDLGKALCDTGQYMRAEAVLRQALALDPALPDLHYFLGNVLAADGRLDAAIASYEHALRLAPEYPDVLSNLALAFSNRGDEEAAITVARRAIELDPRLFHAHSNLLVALSRHPRFSPGAYVAEARAYGTALAAAGISADVLAPSECNPARRLRIGFVSGDLRSHPVGFFLSGVLAHWDRTTMDAIAYSNHRSADALTARLQASFSDWHDIVGMTDDEVKRLIHSHRIDVLLDLSGHTAFNRLPLFARRAASVQASWLGYWASTGVPAMDYVLCDPVSLPRSLADQLTEVPWYLPNTRLCFSPPAGAETLAVAPSPASINGYITFGSFQSLPKLKDAVLQLWARVLDAVPGSRLRLQMAQFNDAVIRDRVRQRLIAIGITEDRIQLVAPMSRLDYLAAHAEVDILLDTFPHGGATTTCEAMWMGVPTIALEGLTMLERQGAALLRCAGLDDWVAHDEDEYVRLAARHAADIESLRKLRLGLRETVSNSPLFDGKLFAANLQDALRSMSCVSDRTINLADG